MNKLCAVLLDRMATVQEAATIVAAWKRVPQADAAREVRGKWNILAEGLNSEQAQTLAECAQAHGFSPILVPQERLVSPPAPSEVSLTSFDDQGFSASRSDGREGQVRWADTGLLALSIHTETTLHTATVVEGHSAGAKALRYGITLTTGIPMGAGKKKTVEKQSETSEIKFLLDVVLQRPFARLRVDSTCQNYALLGARKQMSTSANFRFLVQEFDKYAAGLRNFGLLALLSGKPLQQLGYNTPADIDNELRWMLSLLASKQ